MMKLVSSRSLGVQVGDQSDLSMISNAEGMRLLGYNRGELVAHLSKNMMYLSKCL